ncbi:MAG: PepSY-associated TM helix domain-containing protein [Comamonas sp.]
MSWLHTWSGLVLGWLLFAIFLTGTLSYFKTEFNLWMQPELHGLPPAGPDVAQRAQQALHREAPGVNQWIMRLPDERQPWVSVLWRDQANGRFQTLRMDPVTGQALHPRETMGGEFFYRFHFELRTAKNGRWAIQGRWIVGVATMLMFIALLTGVVTHRRIFKDFFTFRPTKGGQRAWLDAHNVSGVLALPFYLMITFSGLMIFHTLYMPAGIAAAYPGPQGADTQAYFADLVGDPANRPRRRGVADATPPLPLIGLSPILEAARTEWQGGRIASLQARRDGDTVVLEVSRHDGDRLQYRPAHLRFDGTSGARLALADVQSPAVRTYGVLYGLHLARFAGPGLRWALFGFGVLGSLMIATGLVLWVVKRRAQSQRKGATAPPSRGERLVETLNLAALAGLPLAIAAYLAANRLLPTGMAARADTELHCFFAAWGLALAAAALLPDRRGWTLLLALAGAVFAALPVLNALTTNAHLGITLPAGDWAWAGMDLSFLAAATLLGALAWRLRPGRALPQPQARPAAARAMAPSHPKEA